MKADTLKTKTMRVFIAVSIFITIAVAFLGILYSFDFITSFQLQKYATNSVSVGGIIFLASVIISSLLSFRR